MASAFMKELVKEDLIRLIKRASENPEREFITDLGEFENRVVDLEKRLTSEEFDEVCRNLLAKIVREHS